MKALKESEDLQQNSRCTQIVTAFEFCSLLLFFHPVSEIMLHVFHLIVAFELVHNPQYPQSL